MLNDFIAYKGFVGSQTFWVNLKQAYYESLEKKPSLPDLLPGFCCRAITKFAGSKMHFAHFART